MLGVLDAVKVVFSKASKVSGDLSMERVLRELRELRMTEPGQVPVKVIFPYAPDHLDGIELGAPRRQVEQAHPCLEDEVPIAGVVMPRESNREGKHYV